MTNSPPPKPGTTGDQANNTKKARLAAALRENLKRRKAQVRDRTDQPGGKAGKGRAQE